MIPNNHSPQSWETIYATKCTLSTKLETFLLDLNEDVMPMVRFSVREADEEKGKDKSLNNVVS